MVGVPFSVCRISPRIETRLRETVRISRELLNAGKSEMNVYEYYDRNTELIRDTLIEE